MYQEGYPAVYQGGIPSSVPRRHIYREVYIQGGIHREVYIQGGVPRRRGVPMGGVPMGEVYLWEGIP